MTRPANADGLDMVQTNRANRRVPHPPAPGFRKEAHRQALLLRGAPEEAEALDFIEAAAEWGDNET
nr:antitoxin MazE-like protein [uncultured Rhodopila sp.]